MYATSRQQVPTPENVSGAMYPLGRSAAVPLSVEADQPGAEWWLPGPARLCVVVGDGIVSVQLRHRRFSPAPRIAVVGPTDRAHRVSFDGVGVFSIPLSPIGWARMFRRPASQFRNLVVPLEQIASPMLAGRVVDFLRTAAERGAGPSADVDELDGVLGSLPAHRDEPLIAELERLIADPTTTHVGDMHQRLGLSEARLRALASRHFGSPTKMLLRRTRFLRSLAAVDYAPGQNSYSRIDPNYHDVSHFLRDAEYFLGTTPRRFRLLSAPSVPRRR